MAAAACTTLRFWKDEIRRCQRDRDAKSIGTGNLTLMANIDANSHLFR